MFLCCYFLRVVILIFKSTKQFLGENYQHFQFNKFKFSLEITLNKIYQNKLIKIKSFLQLKSPLKWQSKTSCPSKKRLACSLSRSIPILNFHFNVAAAHHQTNAFGRGRQNGEKELREKGALLRYKNNLEIHIKANKVKNFRLKNPFGKREKKIEITKH